MCHRRGRVLDSKKCFGGVDQKRGFKHRFRHKTRRYFLKNYLWKVNSIHKKNKKMYSFILVNRLRVHKNILIRWISQVKCSETNLKIIISISMYNISKIRTSKWKKIKER